MGPFDEEGQNQAAWLLGPNARSQEVLVNVHQEHVIIRVKAIAVNRIDAEIQARNVLDWQPSSYPTLVGCDVAGEIYDAHGSIEPDRFKEGDRVLACTASALNSQEPRQGGFQKFVSVHVDLVSKISESMSFTEAATLPLALTTASQGLYGKEYLYLPWPELHARHIPETEQKWVLIWGASSSVGSAAVQLAAASGMNIVSTSSESHNDLVGSRGATAVFLDNDPELDDQILSVLNRRNFVGVLDAIGTEESKMHIKTILESLGGGVWVSVAELPWVVLPKHVRGKQMAPHRILEDDHEVARKVFGEFLPTALIRGLVRPWLDVHDMGRGWISCKKVLI